MWPNFAQRLPSWMKNFNMSESMGHTWDKESYSGWQFMQARVPPRSGGSWNQPLESDLIHHGDVIRDFNGNFLEVTSAWNWLVRDATPAHDETGEWLAPIHIVASHTEGLVVAIAKCQTAKEKVRSKSWLQGELAMSLWWSKPCWSVVYHCRS